MKRFLYIIFTLFAVCVVQLIFSAEQPAGETSQKPPITSTLYLKNCSDYCLRLSVGPKYPKAIALSSQQVHEFPLMDVNKVRVSSYGKYSPILRDLLLVKVGKFDMAKVLQESPEYSDHDCLINITYEKSSSYHGKWQLSRKIPEAEEVQEPIEIDSQMSALRKVLKYPSSPADDPIAQKAALIWSIFPRVAAKLLAHEQVYPFNILGLDIGGKEPTVDQLTNWGKLLYSVSKKRFVSISDREVWDAVNMIIADAIEWLKLHHHYFVRSADYPLILLQIRTPAADLPQLPAGDASQKLIEQLKEEVKDIPGARMLVGRLEWEMRIKASQTSNEDLSAITPPPPPPPAPSMGMVKETLQEKAITDFLAELEKKRPEEETLLDTTAKTLFEKIDAAGGDHKKIVQLKKAALDRLNLLFAQDNGIKNLPKIRKYVSEAMVRSAYNNNGNSNDNLNEWITLIINAHEADAREYSQMNEEELKKIRQEKLTAQDRQVRLFECLKQVFQQKFQHPQE